MPDLQKFKDHILKQETPQTSMCLVFVLVREPSSQCKNEDVCLEISMPVWEGCKPRRGSASR